MKTIKTAYNEINWEEYFYLDPTSPSGMRWKVTITTGRYGSQIKAVPGQIAGSLATSKGKSYWRVQLTGAKYLVHRIIWVMLHGTIPPGHVINHKNGDGSCNDISNIETRTQKENSMLQSRNTDLDINNVTLVNSHGKCLVWRATWRSVEGVKFAKEFSVRKYGNEQARLLAEEFRKNGKIVVLKELNHL